MDALSICLTKRKKRACQLAFFSPIENITPFQRTIKALIFKENM